MKLKQLMITKYPEISLFMFWVFSVMSILNQNYHDYLQYNCSMYATKYSIWQLVIGDVNGHLFLLIESGFPSFHTDFIGCVFGISLSHKSKLLPLIQKKNETLKT